jgi:asparagine synthase (glutamine-hydrolysing)
MCSILCLLEIKGDAASQREKALQLSRRLRHRGPDWSGIHVDTHAILAHERLSIVDVEHGAQPLKNARGTHILAVNGEIYNHRELEAALATPYALQTRSDCEVILPLYAQRGAEFLDDINGIFAFVLYDADTQDYLIARDAVGVMPLYTGTDAHGQLLVASEMKALVDVCERIQDFPPGHYQTRHTNGPVAYYKPAWREYAAVQGNPADANAIATALQAAVHRQLMSDVPYGTLLSGGLDSSIIAAIAHRYARKRVEEDDRSEAWWPQLHSFSIGLRGSPDLVAAAQVAASIGTVHHGLEFTVQQGIDALDDVIYHLETFDVTTVRASTPMYLMARKIKAMGIKMVLSGEGADEVFGGYLYFHKAPDAAEFHAETVRKLDSLHKFDCLRANKSMAAWGVEARVPFLDQEFLDVAMSIDAQHKMINKDHMEKHLLRQAFEGWVPPEILWRQKEQFSDGVGYAWIDSLKAFAADKVSDQQLQDAASRYPINPPLTKEAYLYRTIFTKHFPGEQAVACVPEGPSIACSTPTALRWDAQFAAMADPSGRAVRGVHRDAYRQG